MGKPVNMRATAVREYMANPDHYGTDDPVEMAKIDMEVGGYEILDHEDTVITIEPIEEPAMTADPLRALVEGAGDGRFNVADSVASWMLHRFPVGSPEATHADTLLDWSNRLRAALSQHFTEEANKARLDLSLYGVSVTRDGVRIDPANVSFHALSHVEPTPPGMVLVPSEPTYEWAMAFSRHTGYTPEEAAETISFLLAAAPAAQVVDLIKEAHQIAFEIGGTDDGEYHFSPDELEDFVRKLPTAAAPAVVVDEAVACSPANAFMLGFEWRQMLNGHVYDGRDVGRTLTARIFDGLDINPNAVDGLVSKDAATCQAIAEIKRAITAALGQGVGRG